MSYHAEVDHSICSGYAECARIAPAAFKLNANNQSEPLPRTSETSDDVLLVAAQECPTNAIRIVSDDGDVVYESA
jgi:ferredoxin